MPRKSAAKKIASKPLSRQRVAPIDVDAWVAAQGVLPIEDVHKVLGEISSV